MDQSTIPLVAGFLGGSSSTVLLYPLDLVKVRLQVNENSSSRSAGALLGRNGSTNGVHRKATGTIAHTMRGVIRHEGLRGLYQGLTPALIGNSASWGGYFFFYERMKKEMIVLKRESHRRNSSLTITKNDQDVILGPLENFTAACLSGAIMVGFTNPIWLIKTRMQLQLKRAQEGQLKQAAQSKSSSSVKPPYTNIFNAAQTIVREEGVLALYRGTIPALMLTTNGGIQFVAYEFLKLNFGEYTKAARENNNHKHGVLERLQDSLGYLSMGAVSKILASTATYPVQLIKSRLQQRSQTAELSSSGEVRIVNRHYRGVVDCAGKIWKNEGLLGFFKGNAANALRVAPSSAITFVVYEGITDMLSSNNKK
eukprot:275785_1